tara:strand:+ start:794 stop:1531 length:738 start_codon:yes stop_codon:yes gene_type:complete
MNNKNIIIGIRPIIESIKNDKNFDKILIKKGLKGNLFFSLLDLIKQSNIKHQFVPIDRLNKISRKNHQGVIGFKNLIAFQNIENIIPVIYEKGENPFLLIVDQVTDTRNLGAIIRVAECSGIHAIIIPENNSAPINELTYKTSAGAINYIPICRHKNLEKTLLYLKESGINIIACSEKSEKLINKINIKSPLCLIIGSEEKGISNKLLELSDEKVKIPLYGKIASLNVSVAAGIILYECAKKIKF